MRSQSIMSLSFVIPAWNEEKYIRKCLTAITREVEKGKHDIEIVVVNNASVDRTRQIALEFPGVIVVDEPRKGLPQARQAGFLASSGDLIANIDADSILPSGWIEKVYEQFSLDDDLVALSGPYEYYDLSKLTNYLVKLYYLPAYGLHLVTHRLLGVGAVLQGGNFVLRRTALEKVGGFNVNIQFYGEDTDIARRIQKVGRVKFLPAFKMRTSGRRLRKEGVLKTGARYAINYFWIICFKKPFTKDYACVSE
jgi:glycosyltransferase involved in cell wall biosynthesis